MTEILDVAIVGGGPAGLSAALMLGRCRRKVVVFDDGRPRNAAALAVHGYLGSDGVKPADLRERGRSDCARYGVRFDDQKVISARRFAADNGTLFDLQTADGLTTQARKVLFATGVQDELPAIPDIRAFYGRSIHHCPYCDGWEHQGQRLVALGDEASAPELARMLRVWSNKVIVCTNGRALPADERQRIERLGVSCREEAVSGLLGADGKLEGVRFESGEPLECDALFFGLGQAERSKLPAMLGCKCDEDGIVQADGQEGSGVAGIFVAGDADGDVQFAIVAAAEGAIAATAINKELLKEDEARTIG